MCSDRRKYRCLKEADQGHGFLVPGDESEQNPSGSRVVAKIEWHRGEFFLRIGFVLTNSRLPARKVIKAYNDRGVWRIGSRKARTPCAERKPAVTGSSQPGPAEHGGSGPQPPAYDPAALCLGRRGKEVHFIKQVTY
jgi:hypothetical protein